MGHAVGLPGKYDGDCVGATVVDGEVGKGVGDPAGYVGLVVGVCAGFAVEGV